MLSQLLHVVKTPQQQTSIDVRDPDPLDEDMLLDNDTNNEIDFSSLSSSSDLTSRPTLHFLAAAENTRLVFCPSIPTLRAYLASLPSTLSQVRTTTQPSSPTTQVLILNILALHDGTSEFSLQGLSRSCALLASCAARLGPEVSVQVLECVDVRDRESVYNGPRLWDAEVPLLSGSIKIGEAGQGWAQRTIPVKKVAERWLRFE